MFEIMILDMTMTGRQIHMAAPTTFTRTQPVIPPQRDQPAINQQGTIGSLSEAKAIV